MEIKLKREEAIKYIEEYYSKLEQRDVKAYIKCSKECCGLYEDECSVVRFYVTEEFNIGGVVKKAKDELSQNRLEEILRALYDLYGFDVKSIRVDASLEEKCSGYGLCESYTTHAKFGGVVLNVEKKKNMVKGKYLG